LVRSSLMRTGPMVKPRRASSEAWAERLAAVDGRASHRSANSCVYIHTDPETLSLDSRFGYAHGELIPAGPLAGPRE